MSAAGTSISRDQVIANIDGVLVQAAGGKIDVMRLIRRNQAASNAADPSSANYVYSNGHSNGVTSSSSVVVNITDPTHSGNGCNSVREGNSHAVLRNNHQRYLIYKDFTSAAHKKGGGYRTRVVAAIGPDGKTLVRDYRDVTATIDSTPDEISLFAGSRHGEGVHLGDDSEPKIRYYLCGLTDRTLWRSGQDGVAEELKIKKGRAEAAEGGEATKDGPKRVAPYHVFLKLFMNTNTGQGPSFADAAETWRGLTKEQQAQYVATPGQFETVQSQNYVLGQHKDGILTQEEHLTYGVATRARRSAGLGDDDAPPQPHVPLYSQPEAVLAAEAVAIGEAKPVDTVLVSASPSKSSVAVKASLHGAKRGRKSRSGDDPSSPSTSSQQLTTDIAPTQLAMASQASAGPAPAEVQQVGNQQPASKKRRSERRSPKSGGGN